VTLKAWTVKVGDLKGLTRAELLFATARCALRAEPWRPAGAEGAWREALDFVARAAFGEPTDAAAASVVARVVGELGARACNRLDGTPDEAVGRAMNYATQTLSAAVEATALAGLPELKKEVVLAAKLSASIGPVLAHAGRVAAPPGTDPVDFAALATCSAIRADLAALRDKEAALRVAADPMVALRAVAPLWPEGVPAWVPAG
jgi:hypothetical protein